jgi:hypothetical protein
MEAAQLAREKAQLECALSSPRVNREAIPAVASTCDRWGAVLKIRQADLGGADVVARDPLILDFTLPANGRFDRRSIRCTGTARRIRNAENGQLWLVVHFDQVFVRSLNGDDDFRSDMFSL